MGERGSENGAAEIGVVGDGKECVAGCGVASGVGQCGTQWAAESGWSMKVVGSSNGWWGKKEAGVEKSVWLVFGKEKRRGKEVTR